MPNTSRPARAVSEAQPIWKAPSLAAVQALPGLNAISEDAGILLVLLSLLSTSEKIPLDLPFRGATSRRRWNAQGLIEDTGASRAGLAPELSSLLSDISRLTNAFHELELAATVSNLDQTYTMNEVISSRVHESLSPENLSFWRFQALVVTYRAIPWKYLEPS